MPATWQSAVTCCRAATVASNVYCYIYYNISGPLPSLSALGTANLPTWLLARIRADGVQVAEHELERERKVALGGAPPSANKSVTPESPKLFVVQISKCVTVGEGLRIMRILASSIRRIFC